MTSLGKAFREQDAPWALLTVPMVEGGNAILRGYASAGATGTSYASWLPAQDCPPPPTETQTPNDGGSVPSGKMLFQWIGTRAAAIGTSDRIVIAATADFARPLLERGGLNTNNIVLDADVARPLLLNQWLFWKVVRTGRATTTESAMPPARFKIDPTLR